MAREGNRSFVTTLFKKKREVGLFSRVGLFWGGEGEGWGGLQYIHYYYSYIDIK